MTSYKRYKICLFILLLFMGAALLFLPASVRANADEESYVAEVNGSPYTSIDTAVTNWNEGTLKLLTDVSVESTISVSKSKTLDLNGKSLTLAAESGSVLRVEEGELTIVGPGEISGGSDVRGGGIYVAGKLTLRGDVTIANNEGSNIYLTNENTINADDFTGRAGVTIPESAREKSFANGSLPDVFFSDDLKYRVALKGGEYYLEISPLGSVEVRYENEETRIFPTTPRDELRKYITVEAKNQNGVKYEEGFTYELSGELSVGTSVVLLKATATTGEVAQTTFDVEVVAPLLLHESVKMEYEQDDSPVYFDSDIELLYQVMHFSVTGSYEDGFDRKIMHTSEATAEENNGYITDYYRVSCDLKNHNNGTAKGKLFVSGSEDSFDFTVKISKYVIDVSKINVQDAIYLEKSGELSARAFTPDLRSGITPVPKIDGSLIDADKLDSQIYNVTISFEVTDKKNYEPIADTRTCRLLVYARAYTVEENGVTYIITHEGGISPEWRFTVTDVTKTVKVRLGQERKLTRIVELTFLPGESTVHPSEFTVTIRLSDKEKKEDSYALFRVLSDGTVEEIGSTREDDSLVFTAGDLLEARFVVATDSNIWLYIALAICFGVLCVIGAIVLMWYLFVKRKIVLID